MPLTAKGEKILANMEQTYGSEKKAKEVLYASKNAGTITGIDSAKLDALVARCDAYDAKRADDWSPEAREAAAKARAAHQHRPNESPYSAANIKARNAENEHRKHEAHAELPPHLRSK